MKTLKDFKFPNMIWTKDNPKSLNGEKEMKKVLRQEAIKWIKHDMKTNCIFSCRNGHSICHSHIFWMERFNITEEGLK